MAFDLDGQLWAIEMGPAGGDELNRIVREGNYGYPVVSNGDHYDRREIPDHDTRPEFDEPAIWWTPVISPGDLMVYRGDLFPAWRGDAFAAGLSSGAIVNMLPKPKEGGARRAMNWLSDSLKLRWLRSSRMTRGSYVTPFKPRLIVDCDTPRPRASFLNCASQVLNPAPPFPQ